MKTEDFLDILEHRQLISGQIAEKIRAKLGEGKQRLTAKSLLKYLVKKELVSRRDAKQLLETTLSVTNKAESSILGMIPLPEVPAERELKPGQSIVADDVEEEIPVATPVGQESLPPVEPDLGEPLLDPMLVGEATEEASALADADVVSGKKKKKRRRKKGRKENEWDSPLLLIGGGALVALLILGALIWYLLSRENADQILKEASEYFDGGSYTQSIKQYERFVEGFPKHPHISSAKVRLGMARLWKATEGSSDYANALKTAQQVLGEIENEESFPEAQEDLASLLPKIATGLAEQAEKGEDLDLIKERVDQATQTLSLCVNTKYIPKTFRNDPVLDEVKATLARVERRRQQNVDLQKGLQEIDEAIGQLDITKAYAIQKSLIGKHPGLLVDETLAAKVREISQAEKSVVKFVAEQQPAETEARESNIVASLVLAERRGPAAAGEPGNVAVTIDGAVYGLNAKDGSVLWRQFLGLESQTAPVPLDGGDFLVVNAGHQELLRLAGPTGELVWRQTLGAPLNRPVVAGEQILVTSTSGKMFVLEKASGALVGYVEFGQSICVPPAVDRSGKRIFVIGEHSSFYTLDADDMHCMEVFYLGHAKGSIATAPVAILNKVAVAEITGVATSQLRLLGTNETGAVTTEVEIGTGRLKGLVNTPLQLENRRLVMLTSRGEVAVFEVGTGDGSTALTLLAKRDAVGRKPVARFGVVDEGHVWVGGTQLSKLAIVPTGGQLPVRDVDRNYSGSIFDHPLQIAGDLIIHVRRPANQAGAIVGAIDNQSGKSSWETHLAVPPAGPPLVDPRGPKITSASATGAVFVLDRQAMARRVQDEGQRDDTWSTSSQPLEAATELAQGQMVFSARQDADQILLFQPEALRNPLRTVPLESKLACPPVAWLDGAAVATRVGQLLLVDPTSGKPACAPFQPPLTPEADYRWLPPVVVGMGNSAQLVLSDGNEKIYLLSRQAEPQPHLVASAESLVGPSPLVSRLATLGNAVLAGTEDGRLIPFQLPELKAAEGIELGAPVVWGPYPAGDRLILATANDELLCTDGSTVVWRRPLPDGLPINHPLTVEGDVFLLWQNSTLTRHRLDNGQPSGSLSLDEPVVAGPVPMGSRLVLSSHDGTLLVVETPEQEE